MSSATIRRLSDEDVRAIFESVHNNHRPPPHLQFKIVRVGPEGLKLSPPSYEFEDGLYVLLKPEKKKNPSSREIPSQTQKIPSKLSDYLMKETPPSSCPWSLSGPQFPKPTAIQQRYCYPKGNPEYSSRKGGALWTMYGPDGKENLEYRLLHVYFSAKRAVNKGVSVPSEVLALPSGPSSTPSRPIKRAKKQTPTRRSVKTPVSLRNNLQVLSHSPVLSFDMTEDPSCLSPMVMPAYNQVLRGSTDAFPPLPATFVTPQSNAASSDRVFEQRFHPVGDQPSPFRPRVLDIASPDRSTAMTTASNNAGGRTRDSDSASMDPFPWEDNDETMKQLEEACWNEPLFIPPPEETQEKETEKDHIIQFAGRLESLRESFRDQILSAKESDQAALLSMITSWARELAQDPLRNSSETKQVTQV